MITDKPVNASLIKFNSSVGGSLTGDHTQHPLIQKFAKDPIIEALVRSIHGYRNWYDRVKNSMSVIDPTQTEKGQFIANHERASRSLGEAAKVGTSAAEAAQASLAGVERDIDSALGIKQDENSREIRDRLAGMTPTERLSAAHAAIEAGDASFLGAVLAPKSAFTTGFTQDERAVLRNRYAEVHAPEVLERRKAIGVALEASQKANMDAIATMGATFDHQAVATITAQRDTAREVQRQL